jgi:ketosteroid isomerase-like protein
VSTQSVEAVRRGLEAFNRRDKAAWIANCDPDVENIPPREWPESARIQGPEAIWDFFVEAQSTWDEGAYEWGELIEIGPDKVVANQRREMHGRTSGAAVAWSYWVVLTLRNGRVLRFEWFDDRAEAIEAGGIDS